LKSDSLNLGSEKKAEISEISLKINDLRDWPQIKHRAACAATTGNYRHKRAQRTQRRKNLLLRSFAAVFLSGKQEFA
jgi:hypothetical protein